MTLQNLGKRRQCRERHRFRLIGLALFTTLLVWVGQAGFGARLGLAAMQPPTEIRGVWLTNVDSEVLFSTGALDETLQHLADSHFNTIYPAIWSWGYTLYPSAVGQKVIGYKQGLYPDLEDEGRDEALEAAQGDRDMLLEMIELARDRELSVIPWFEFGFMAPATSPLAERHPDWLTQKQGQRPEARLYQEGRHTRVWLNPFHPEVQQFMLELVAELMANYPVDGLQLDDHFSLPVTFGYDPYTMGLYQREHQGQLPPTNPYDAEWMRWRADKLTQFLGQVFGVVKAHRPDSVLSVSPNPAHFAYNHFLQDWPRWRELGYVEELMVQVYRDRLATFRRTLQEPEIQQSRAHIPTGIGILGGLKDRPVPISLIRQQVETARSMGFAGVSFFFYDTLWSPASGEVRGDRVAAIQAQFAQRRDRASL